MPHLPSNIQLNHNYKNPEKCWEEDSNLRRLAPMVLQTIPIVHSGIPAYQGTVASQLQYHLSKFFISPLNNFRMRKRLNKQSAEFR